MATAAIRTSDGRLMVTGTLHANRMYGCSDLFRNLQLARPSRRKKTASARAIMNQLRIDGFLSVTNAL